MGEFQKTGKPFSHRPPEGFHRHPVIGAIQDGTDGNDQHVWQFVFLVPFDPRIGQIPEILQQSSGSVLFHAQTPCPRTFLFRRLPYIYPLCELRYLLQ